MILFCRHIAPSLVFYAFSIYIPHSEILHYTRTLPGAFERLNWGVYPDSFLRTLDLPNTDLPRTPHYTRARETTPYRARWGAVPISYLSADFVVYLLSRCFRRLWSRSTQ